MFYIIVFRVVKYNLCEMYCEQNKWLFFKKSLLDFIHISKHYTISATGMFMIAESIGRVLYCIPDLFVEMFDPLSACCWKKNILEWLD